MIDEQCKECDQRLIAAALFYFGQRDAGLELRLTDVLEVIEPELHRDLVHLVIRLNCGRLNNAPDTERGSKPIEVIQKALRELRGKKIVHD